jgi:hypothetical protein
MAKKHGKSSVGSGSKDASSQLAEDHRLLLIVEKSQVPFGESANLYASLKRKIEAYTTLSPQEHEQLLTLVQKAKEWEKGVASSASTEREETLAG